MVCPMKISNWSESTSSFVRHLEREMQLCFGAFGPASEADG
jgi:hypothetical protein